MHNKSNLKNIAEIETTRDHAIIANKIKEQFLIDISHELRTPLNGIMGIIEMLQKENMNMHHKIQIEKMKECSSTMLAMINDITDFSNIESKQFEVKNTVFDFKTIVDEFVSHYRSIAHKNGIDFVFFKSPDFPREIYGDSDRTKKMIQHLLNNAIKYTPEGVISLELLYYPGEELDLELVVQDSGIGIQESVLPYIFEPYKQSVDGLNNKQVGGAGLGLALCKKIVDSIGGKILVNSQVGTGTVFIIRWPSQQIKKNQSNGSELENKNSELKSMKILVVDDVPLNREVAKVYLESDQHIVIEANNGLEAVQRIQEDPQFDLILMDCQMPMMDGFEATQQIIQLLGNKTPPIIALTASAMKETEVKSLNSGMSAFVTKPIDYIALKKVISRVLKPNQNSA